VFIATQLSITHYLMVWTITWRSCLSVWLLLLPSLLLNHFTIASYCTPYHVFDEIGIGSGSSTSVCAQCRWWKYLRLIIYLSTYPLTIFFVYIFSFAVLVTLFQIS
jgi:hypothetical protein